MQLRMGFDLCESIGKSEIKTIDWLGREVRFYSSEHEAAYKKLTFRRMQYIASYLAANTLDDVIRELGLEGSRATVAKEIRRIAKKMGCTIRELKGKIVTASPSPKQLKQLIEAQEFRCSLSGEKLSPDNAELDHKIPLSTGGRCDIENLQWVLAEINRMKGTMGQARFIELCRKVAKWNG